MLSPARLQLTICLGQLGVHKKKRWTQDTREKLLDGEPHRAGPRGLASAGAPRGAELPLTLHPGCPVKCTTGEFLT